MDRMITDYPKFAAADIGTNAVRLLLMGVFDQEKEPYFKRISLIRMPLRLGEDVFTRGRIPESMIKKLVETMQGFRHIIEAWNPVDFRGCATSAMRESANGHKVCKRIKKEAGLDIEIISGRQEAKYLFANKNTDILTAMKTFLFVDVGGGSTEITLFSKGRAMASESFNIGTIRLLKDMVTQTMWQDMKAWVIGNAGKFEGITAIGTGGNINKLSKLANGKKGNNISYRKLKKARSELKEYSFSERVTVVGLRPDRADVIIPASEIYLNIMKWGNIDTIHVPVVGLADGLIRIMYEKHFAAPPKKRK